MKRRTALQVVASMATSYFPQDKTFKSSTVALIDKPAKISFWLKLDQIQEIRVSWGESSVQIDLQELWDALHRKD